MGVSPIGIECPSWQQIKVCQAEDNGVTCDAKALILNHEAVFHPFWRTIKTNSFCVPCSVLHQDDPSIVIARHVWQLFRRTGTADPTYKIPLGLVFIDNMGSDRADHS